MPPSYWECPKYCPEKKTALKELCSSCPVAEQENEFRSETEQALNEALGDKWKGWTIRTLLNDVTDAFYLLEADPETLTATAARVIQIVKGEQARQRRIEDYNRQLTFKNKNG